MGIVTWETTPPFRSKMSNTHNSDLDLLMTSSAINAGREGGLSPPPLLNGASREEGLARVQQWLKVFIDFAPNVSVCTEWGTVVNKYHGGSRIQIDVPRRSFLHSNVAGVVLDLK